MKKAITFVFIVLPLAVFSQSWRSSNALQGTADISILKSVSDTSKNTIIFGHFTGSITPDGAAQVDARGGRDYFLAKYDSASNLLWIKGMGSTLNEFFDGSAAVGIDGSIYVTGSFQGDFYYDETNYLTTTNFHDIFLAKYDPDGNTEWCYNMGSGQGAQRSTAISIDNDENILLGGYYSDSVNMNSQITLYTDNAFKDYFYAKIESTNGNVIWARPLKSIDSNFSGFIYSFSPTDKHYIISGVFADTVDLGNDTIVSRTVNYYDTHIIKTDTSGNILWTRKIQGSLWDYSYNSVVNPEDSSIYITGYYNSDTLFIDSTAVDTVTLVANNGGYDFFVAKYNTTGTLEWIRSNGGESDDRLLQSQFYNNELYVTGFFADTMYWGGVELATNGPGDVDMFYGTITADGEYRSATQFSGKSSSTEEGRGVFNTATSQYAVIRSNSELLEIGDSSYINLSLNYFIVVGTIGCLPISFDEVTPTNVGTCNGDATGSIYIDVSGGFGAPFEYSIDNGNTYQGNATFNNIPAGTYQTTVIDAENCAQAGPEVTVSEPPIISITDVDSSDVVCNGGTSGSINVTASGGTGALSYSLDNGATFIQSTGVATPVGAGIYNIVLKDINNCQVAGPEVTIEEPDAIAATLDGTTPATCFGGANAEATITVTGGTGAYTFSWDGQITAHNSTSEDPTDLMADTYDLTVTDAASCEQIFTDFAVIGEADEITADTAITDIQCFGGSDGAIDLIPGGGTPSGTGTGYTYAWTGPNSFSSTDEDISSLEAGDYFVTITDGNTCSKDFGPFTIEVVNTALSVVLDGTTDATCNASATGTASITASGGTGPYTYSWNGQSTAHNTTDEDPTNLYADTYDVTITDDNLCQRTFTSVATIDEPSAITIIEAINDVLCFGGSSGSIINTGVTGGTPFASGDPYLFEWSDGTNIIATTQNIEGITAGEYTYNVTDANGCEAVFGPFTVSEGPEIIATLDNATDVICAGDTSGTAQITASGGTGSLSFEWNGQTTSFRTTSEDPARLMADIYDLTVKDGNNCEQPFAAIATISEPAEITADTSVTHILCYGASTGAIDLIPSGGTPSGTGTGYTYAWSGPDGFISTDEDISGLVGGDYTVTVTDGSGCSEIFGPFTVNENDPIIFSLDQTVDIACNGDADGAIFITPSGGSGAYTYAWTGQNTGATSTEQDPLNLPADTYDLVITDGDGCSEIFTDAAAIAEPTALGIAGIDQTDVLCNGTNSASFIINATGGTSPYLYSNDGTKYQSSAQFNNLNAGTYAAYVKDDHDCVFSGDEVVITEPAPLQSAIDEQSDVVCYGENTGSFTISASGGTAPYLYSIDGGATTQDNGVFEELAADAYDVTITDANGCSTVHSNIIISEPPTFGLIVNKTDVLCFGRDNGNFTLTATGGTAPYEYSIDDGATFTNQTAYFFLEPNTFYVQVKDANGCMITGETVVINEPDSMEVSDVLVTDLVCYEEGSGSLLVRAIGGSEPYQFALNGGAFQNDSLFEDLPIGAYSVTVADKWGCVATGTASVSQPEELTMTAASTNVLCDGGSDGTLTVTPAGGTPPYSYSLDSIDFVTDSTFTGFVAGTYTVHVLDSNNCHVKDTNIVVESNDPLTLDIVSFTNILPTEPGEIVAQAAGGSAPYLYTLNPGNVEQTDDGTFEITTGNEGTYTITVDDENNCGPVTSDEIVILGSGKSMLYSDFNMYPNPTNGLITIEFSTEKQETELEIISIDGKQLLNREVYSSHGKVTEKIDLSSLREGIYFIRLDKYTIPTGIVLE